MQGDRWDVRRRLERRARALGRLFAEAATLHALSRRETEVARLVFAGRTNSEIAVRVGRSLSAVKTYRLRAFRKFGARSVVEFVHAVHLSGGEDLSRRSR